MENERRGKRRGEKDAKRKGKERRNGKIKEEERRRRSADDDNGSGQGAVEREKKGKEEDSVVRVWERDKGWKGGGGREKRLPDGTPQRSGGSIDPECRRPPARNALFYSFATQSPSSLFRVSIPSHPPPPARRFFSSCLALSPFCFPSSFFRLSSRLLAPFFTSLLFLEPTVFLVTPIYYISLLCLLIYLRF